LSLDSSPFRGISARNTGAGGYQGENRNLRILKLVLQKKIPVTVMPVIILLFSLLPIIGYCIGVVVDQG